MKKLLFLGGALVLAAAAFVLADVVMRESAPQVAKRIGAQKYWLAEDVAPGLGVGGNECTEEDLEKLSELYGRPPMMAIGDSLYNGVQSLRINWWLSEWSTPTLVAIRFGLVEEKYADRTGRREFYTPQYPTHGSSPVQTVDYGFNIERFSASTRLLRWFEFQAMPRRQANRLQYLMEEYRPPNNRAFADNIAFSGANTIDLLHSSTEVLRLNARRALDIAEKRTLWSGAEKFGNLGNAFTFANAAFVLNPTRNPCIEKMTPVEQVEFRKPSRLLINIGSNNGIYKVGLAGANLDTDSCSDLDHQFIGEKRCYGSLRDFIGKRYEKDIAEIVDRLKKVDGLEYVYINGLPRPGLTANILYETDPENGQQVIRTHLTKKEIGPADLAEADALASAVNDRIKALLESANASGDEEAPKFQFVDIAQYLEDYDFKGCLARESDPQKCESRRFRIKSHVFSGLADGRDVLLDNRPLSAVGVSGVLTGDAFARKLQAGGLFSFDNMHLSSIGYEHMAMAVRLAFEEAGDPWVERNPDQCKVPPEPVEPGACAKLLTKPGWAFVDATRREFIFQRVAGDREMEGEGLIRSILSFSN